MAVSELEFTRPTWCWMLLMLPVMVLIASRAVRLRHRSWKRLEKSPATTGEADWRWIVVLALIVIAAAGPRWDLVSREFAGRGQDVMLVVDTSRSMGATDALPNRMGTAVESAMSLVQAMGAEEGGRVGVVAFAGRGVVRCPLTENLGVATDALKALRPGDVRPGGTNLAAGVNVALRAFTTSDPLVPRMIVLFTDGEDHTGSWPALVARLRREKVMLHGVAIGDVEKGHPVPVGGGKSLEFAGELVKSRRNDTPIDALAAATGGAVVRVGLAPVDLRVLFDRRIKPFAAQRREQLRRQSERADRHVPFLFAAIAVAVSACAPWRIRAGGAVWILLLVAAGASPGNPSIAEWVRRGKAAYDRRDWHSAREAFDRATRVDPRSAVAFYDAAATEFQLARFDEALRLYQRANTLTRDPGLRMKIQFALGNVYVALDRRPEAIVAYDACLASTVPGPSYDRIRHDAAINRRFAERPPPSSPRPEDRGGSNPSESAKSKKTQPPGENPTSPSSDGAGDADDTGTAATDATAEAGESELADPKSLRQRFQDALDNARQARDFRPSDDGRRPLPETSMKDW